MAQSLFDTLYKIEGLKQQLAVWNSVTNHLSKFLDTEALETQEGIPAPGCVRPENRVRGREVVPQEVIESIIKGIEEDRIDPITKEVSSLENSVVVEASSASEKAPDESNKKTVQKPSTASKNTKRVRIISPAARG